MYSTPVSRMTPAELYALEDEIMAAPDDHPVRVGQAVARALDAHESTLTR